MYCTTQEVSCREGMGDLQTSLTEMYRKWNLRLYLTQTTTITVDQQICTNVLTIYGGYSLRSFFSTCVMVVFSKWNTYMGLGQGKGVTA